MDSQVRFANPILSIYSNYTSLFHNFILIFICSITFTYDINYNRPTATNISQHVVIQHNKRLFAALVRGQGQCSGRWCGFSHNGSGTQTLLLAQDHFNCLEKPVHEKTGQSTRSKIIFSNVQSKARPSLSPNSFSCYGIRSLSTFPLAPLLGSIPCPFESSNSQHVT